MGRKRKTVTFADEDKTSIACQEVTTSTDEKIHSHTDNSNDLQEKTKKSTDINVFVRRSGRIKSSVLSSGNEGGVKAKPVVEHIDVVEEADVITTVPEVNDERNYLQENDDYVSVAAEEFKSKVDKGGAKGKPLVEHINVVGNENEEIAEVITTVPEVRIYERNLQENDDYVSIVAEEFKSKVDKGPQEGCYPNFSYKSLYIASQKKIEALMEANYEMVKKLEFALGKVEAYEKMSFGWGASKRLLLASNMGNEKEATVTISPQTTVEKCTDSPLDDATKDAIDDDNRNKKSYKKRKAKVC